MAINSSNNNTNNNQSASAPNQGGQPGGWSFHDSNIFNTPIPRGIGSEEYTKMKETLLGFFKNANDRVEVSLLDLSNSEERSLCYSAIVVTMRDKQNPETGVAYHTLLLEGTGDKLKPVYETIGNDNVEILRVASDAKDEHLLRLVLNLVRQTYPTGPYHTTDGTVIPATFKVTAPEQVVKLAANTGLALWSELNRRNPGFKDLDLGQLQRDSTLAMNCSFGRQQIIDAVGNPIRSDIIVDLSSKKGGTNNSRTSVNNGDRELNIAQISGYIDLLWNPAVVQNPYQMYQNQMQGPNHRYSARMVVTHLQPTSTYTVGGVLLALANIIGIRDGNNWVQAFRPQITDSKVIDINDIGAVNIEANIKNETENGPYGSIIDTKDRGFKLTDLGQMLSALVRPGLITSLDCPEATCSTHYTSVFAAASAGHQSAYETLYQAANQLTHGNFERYFPHGTPMFTDMNNRIHLGTYTDHNGVARDIRDIDYVAMCNLVGRNNPMAIRHYTDTFLNTNIPLPTRLAKRRSLISSVTNETAVFTGFAQRVTCAGKFIDAISMGIRDTGLSVRVTTPLTGNDFNDQRGVADFSSAALSAPGQSFVNTGGYGYANQFNPSMYNNGGRWY